MADLTPLAAAIAAQGTASFQHGFGLGAPRCTADGWLGVGVTDLTSRRTRVVQVSVSRQTRRRWETKRSWNPIEAVGNTVVRRAVRRWGGVPQEWRFDSAGTAVRGGPDEPWRDRTAPDAEPGRRLLIDPTWPLELLAATPAAVRTHSEREHDVERHVDVELDAAAVADLLPAELADAALDPSAREHIGSLSLQVVFAGDHPVRVATLAGKASETGDPLWRVLAFTSLGIDPEAVDLWEAWARLSPRA